MTMEELNEMILHVAQPRAREMFEWMLDSEEQPRADPRHMPLLELNDLFASVAIPVHKLKDDDKLAWLLEQQELPNRGPHVDGLTFEDANVPIERLAA